MTHRGGATRWRRAAGDRGAATSLATALLTPVFVVLAFAAFQAALWNHARTEARVVAHDTAGLVATRAAAPDDARRAAHDVLVADTDLRDVEVRVDDDGLIVVVTVTGAAPGIVRGTASTVSVTAAVPREGWRP